MPNTFDEPGEEYGTLERRPVEVAMATEASELMRLVLNPLSAALVLNDLSVWEPGFFLGALVILRPLAALLVVSLQLE
jgi:hypothetical protein